MKKILLFMLGGLMSLPVLGTDFTYENQGQTLSYTILDENAKTCMVNSNNNKNGTNISGKVEIPETVIYDNTEYSVTSIGTKAFSSCSGLSEVTIPTSVTSIGNDAFYNCSGLTSMKIPDSVTSIGTYAFSNCSGLTSLTISSSLTSINDCTFSGCSSLTSVTIPGSVTSIEWSAFSGCSNLAEVTIPNSVSSIGQTAFSDCTSLTSVTIPASVTSIGMKAFSSSGLTSVTIPGSVTSMGRYAFSACGSLTSVNIQNSTVSDYAFMECLNLETVILGENVTSIGEGAFAISSEDEMTSKINKIISVRATPPTLASTAFNSSVKSNATVYAPLSSLESYRNADGWSEFKNYADVTLGVENITGGRNEGVEIYTLDGVRIFKGAESDIKLGAGIYIIRQGNDVKKISVK